MGLLGWIHENESNTNVSKGTNHDFVANCF